MLSRRLIRIKVFKVLYSKIASEENSLVNARKELQVSCDRTLDLYFFMLNISLALRTAAELKIELGLNKFRKTEQDANPNRRFVENKFLEVLAAKEDFTAYCQRKGLIWSDDLMTFVKKLYASIQEREYFIEYMNLENATLEDDCNVLKMIFQEEFEDNDDLADILEDISAYWMDDLAYVLNLIIRDLDNYSKSEVISMPSVFLKEDDKDFAITLLENSIVNYHKYESLVNSMVQNWDSERIVSTDICLIVQGIVEAVKFSSIPVKVTINEYVEVSKFYSTINSRSFVNGLLDKIIKKLMEEGEIVKTGRGLIS